MKYSLRGYWRTCELPEGDKETCADGDHIVRGQKVFVGMLTPYEEKEGGGSTLGETRRVIVHAYCFGEFLDDLLAEHEVVLGRTAGQPHPSTCVCEECIEEALRRFKGKLIRLPGEAGASKTLDGLDGWMYASPPDGSTFSDVEEWQGADFTSSFKKMYEKTRSFVPPRYEAIALPADMREETGIWGIASDGPSGLLFFTAEPQKGEGRVHFGSVEAAIKAAKGGGAQGAKKRDRRSFRSKFAGSLPKKDDPWRSYGQKFAQGKGKR